MKKLVSILLAASVMMSLAACGSQGGETAKDDSVLRVGMECNYAPYNWSQADEAEGTMPIANVDAMYTNGYDVQVAKNIAEKLGKTLEIYSYEWDSLIPGVQSGKLDMVIAGMSPTAERREKIDFSDNYFTSNLVVVTKKGNLSDVKTIADLDGKKIAAQSGTFHLEALTEQTTAKAEEMNDFTTMLIALGAGTIEGYIAEEPTAMAVCLDPAYDYIPLVNNETGFAVEDDDVSIAVGVKKGSELQAQINEALADFDTDAQKALMNEMVAVAPAEEE